MKNYKCENCKKYVSRGKYFTFYLHMNTISIETETLSLCNICFNLCHGYYYNKEKSKKTYQQELRIPNYIPYDQHKKYLLIKMKQDKLSNDSKL